MIDAAPAANKHQTITIFKLILFVESEFGSATAAGAVTIVLGPSLAAFFFIFFDCDLLDAGVCAVELHVLQIASLSKSLAAIAQFFA